MQLTFAISALLASTASAATLGDYSTSNTGKSHPELSEYRRALKGGIDIHRALASDYSTGNAGKSHPELSEYRRALKGGIDIH
jgi:hypothetical protein